MTPKPEFWNGGVEATCREFVAYWLREGGCGMCGGLPHSASCFVGRIEVALLAEAERPVWQPMETAPRDRAWVLVIHDGQVFRAHYQIGGTWWADNGGLVQPTCWQPLPAPPLTLPETKE